MQSIERLALSKVVKEKDEKAARLEITSGVYAVSFAASIQGTLKVGEDYEQNIVAKADPWLLLSVALSKLNGVTIADLTAEALRGKISTADVKERAENAMGLLKAATNQICRGKVTTDLTVSRLDFVR